MNTALECKEACVAQAGCAAWVMFGPNCNTGPNHTRTMHSCNLITDAEAAWSEDGHYISGQRETV